MNFELIISVAIFFIGFILFLCWQPTRVVLKEILFHPFSNSKIRIVPKEAPKEDNYSTKSKVESQRPSTTSARVN